MSPTAQRLATVNVQARRNNGRGNQRTPGSTERDISIRDGGPACPSTRATERARRVGARCRRHRRHRFHRYAVLVAGLRPTANSVTLDGLSFGSGSVPQDAVRSTQICTSTYDVARGEFLGRPRRVDDARGSNSPRVVHVHAARSGPGVGRRRFIAVGGLHPESVRGRRWAAPSSGQAVVFGAVQGRWPTTSCRRWLNRPRRPDRLG